MSGFKAFILRGGLVELAVAFIMATAFAAVVSSFVAWLMGVLPGWAGEVFKGAVEGDLGFFINQVITFVVIGAVVYFLVVVPYTTAKQRFFPDPEPGATELDLLTEIRDELKTQRGTA